MEDVEFGDSIGVLDLTSFFRHKGSLLGSSSVIHGLDRFRTILIERRSCWIFLWEGRGWGSGLVLWRCCCASKSFHLDENSLTLWGERREGLCPWICSFSWNARTSVKLVSFLFFFFCSNILFHFEHRYPLHITHESDPLMDRSNLTSSIPIFHWLLLHFLFLHLFLSAPTDSSKLCSYSLSFISLYNNAFWAEGT